VNLYLNHYISLYKFQDLKLDALSRDSMRRYGEIPGFLSVHQNYRARKVYVQSLGNNDTEGIELGLSPVKDDGHMT